MKRTTVVSAEGEGAARQGSLKLFFSYAPLTGTTTALLDELQGMVGRGKDVLLSELVVPSTGSLVGTPFDVDQALKRRPDLVALDDFAAPNPPGSRNAHRYQDALELLHAGIDVYAVLRVSNLESECDRVAQITGSQPSDLVPDRLFYEADQVEFVDIDPQELSERSHGMGRSVGDIDVLRQLRNLAMQCVSFYVASDTASCGPAPAAAAVASPRDRVLALVDPDEEPTSVLHEAARLTGVSDAPPQAVCVRHEGRGSSPDTGDDDPDQARLQAKVDALGWELVTLWGSSAADVLRDYVRLHGISDLVLSDTLLARLQEEDRASRRRLSHDALDGARVHVVPGASPRARRHRPIRGGLGSLMDFDAFGVLVALVAVALSIGAAWALYYAGVGMEVYLLYILAATVVAAYTKSYVPSLLTIGACCAIEATVLLPHFSVTLDSAGYFSYALMAVVMLLVSFTAVAMGRAEARARYREQHTQSIYELGKRLAFSHGQIEVVDVSLDALVRLFGRSVAFYTADPFDRDVARREGPRAGMPTCKTVAGDMEAREFERITERNVAHWVFANAAPAGAGTDTNSTSDALYLPLEMDDSVIGVVAVSARRQLTASDRSFLDMVISQVLGAFERQALAVSHKVDLRAMRVSQIRDGFIASLVSSVSQSAGTMAEMTRMLQVTRDDDTLYREAVQDACGMESLRTHVMADRVGVALSEEQSRAKCDVRAMVGQAVTEVRRGRGSTSIVMEPSEDVPRLVADTELLRLATVLIMESSLALAPVGGVVTVGVHGHPGFVTVSVSDDRPDALSGPAVAFARGYDADRARRLVAFLSDHGAVTDESQSLPSLAQALGVPRAACMVDGRADARRIGRIDRTQYGLYVAALVVRAHGGEIKTRHRLGGGSVTSYHLPVA